MNANNERPTPTRHKAPDAVRAEFAPAPYRLYALLDPNTFTPFYVGYTKHPLNIRLNRHIADARDGKGTRGSQKKIAYIRRLLFAGREPFICELQVPPGITHDWERAEAAWIALYKSAGIELTNEAEGGAGSTGAMKNEETRAKMSEGMRAAHARRRAGER